MRINPEKTSPRKPVPTGDRTRALCVTSAHATTCSTAVDSLKSILISSHLRLGHPKGLFPSGFPTKTLYAFLDCSIRATCPAHLSRLYLRSLIMLGKKYNACSSALCNFLHSPVISSLLAPNIFLSTLFSNTLILCSSLKVRTKFHNRSIQPVI